MVEMTRRTWGLDASRVVTAVVRFAPALRGDAWQRGGVRGGLERAGPHGLQGQEEVVAPVEDHHVLDLTPGDLSGQAGELAADHVGGGRVAACPVVGEPGVAGLAPAVVRERTEVDLAGRGQDLDPAPCLGAVGGIKRISSVKLSPSVPTGPRGTAGCAVARTLATWTAAACNAAVAAAAWLRTSRSSRPSTPSGRNARSFLMVSDLRIVTGRPPREHRSRSVARTRFVTATGSWRAQGARRSRSTRVGLPTAYDQ